MSLSWLHNASVTSRGQSSVSKLLTMETVSSVTSFRTSITEMQPSLLAMARAEVPFCQTERSRLGQISKDFMGHYFEKKYKVCSCSLLLSRWAELHASTTVSQCLCVPAGPPGAVECNQAEGQTKTSFKGRYTDE